MNGHDSKNEWQAPKQVCGTRNYLKSSLNSYKIHKLSTTKHSVVFAGHSLESLADNKWCHIMLRLISSSGYFIILCELRLHYYSKVDIQRGQVLCSSRAAMVLLAKFLHLDHFNLSRNQLPGFKFRQVCPHSGYKSSPSFLYKVDIFHQNP